MNWIFELLEVLLKNLQAFALDEPVIKAIILIGSHARGRAGPHSDVDLVLITSDRDHLLKDTKWIERFGPVGSFEVEDYGLVQSLRVFYENGTEVEFGITSLEWLAETERQSTGDILSAGYRVIYDPSALIDAFCGSGK